VPGCKAPRFHIVQDITLFADVQAIRGSLLKQTKFILRKSAVLPVFSRPRFVQRR